VAKNFLEENKIGFEYKDVATDEKAREEMIKKTGQMGVPVIDIEGEIIIGFNEGRIRELLDIQ
jgi:glutaredoxin